MAGLLLFTFFFFEILLTPTMGRLGPSPAKPGLLVLEAKSDAAKAPSLGFLLQLSPSSPPEFARHQQRQASKVELATSKVIAAGFIAAFVVAAFVYIRVTRKRATDNSKY